MPSYFLANRPVNEVTEFGIIAVAQEGADFKTELLPSGWPRDKLGGVIVGSRLRITAIRIGPLCNRRRDRRRVSAKAAAELNNPNAMSESVIFSWCLPCKMLCAALKVGRVRAPAPAQLIIPWRSTAPTITGAVGARQNHRPTSVPSAFGFAGSPEKSQSTPAATASIR